MDNFPVFTSRGYCVYSKSMNKIYTAEDFKRWGASGGKKKWDNLSPEQREELIARQLANLKKGKKKRKVNHNTVGGIDKESRTL